MNQVIINGVTYVPANMSANFGEVMSRLEALMQDVNSLVSEYGGIPVAAREQAPVISMGDGPIRATYNGHGRDARQVDAAVLRAYRNFEKSKQQWNFQSLAEAAGVTKSSSYHAAERLIKRGKMNLRLCTSNTLKLRKLEMMNKLEGKIEGLWGAQEGSTV